MDILSCANNCLTFTKDISIDQFQKDTLVFAAVNHQLIILAEDIFELGTQKELLVKLGKNLIDQHYDTNSKKLEKRLRTNFQD